MKILVVAATKLEIAPFLKKNNSAEVLICGAGIPSTVYHLTKKLLQNNYDTVEFKNINPTAENIAIVVYNILREKIDKKLDLKIKLYETEGNFVEYPAN